MKKMYLKITAILLGILPCISGFSQGENLQYTVIHHEGTQVKVFDSIVGSGEDYTIQDYLNDLNLSIEETEIIEISGEMEFWNTDSEIWFMHNEESENGNMTRTFEITMDDENAFHSDHEIEIVKGEMMENGTPSGEEVIVKTIIIEENEIIEGDIDIEEVIDTENKQHRIIMEREQGDTPSDEMIEMDVRVEKIVDENGEEQVFMWINGEEVDPEEVNENLFIPENLDLPEGAEIIIIEETDCPIFEFSEMSDFSFTMAIVSPVSENSETPEKMISNQPANISELTFSPVGGDQYRISFESKKPAQTSIMIYDIQGKEIYSKDLGNFEGSYNEDFNLNLNSGAYILNIIQNNERVVKKMIVQ